MRYIISLIFVLMVSVTAAAGSSFDMTQVIRDPDGRPMRDVFDPKSEGDSTCSKCRNMTLGRAIAGALFLTYKDDKSLTGEQKFARGDLAFRIESDPHAQLSIEELALAKKVVGEYYSPMAVRQIWLMLDPTVTSIKVH